MTVISWMQKMNLKRAFLEMDNKKISQFLQDKGGDWIK